MKSVELTSNADQNRLLNFVLERLARNIQHGSLCFETPNGQRYTLHGKLDDAPAAHIRILNWRCLLAAVTRGALGFAEAYLDGGWDTEDLRALLMFAARNEAHLESLAVDSALLRFADRWRHWRRRNSPRQAARNIAYHYDLGNAFYQHWLDCSMTYSAGIFNQPGESLEQAQQNKYARLAAMAELQPGSEVLEIGCGWGGFMAHASQHYNATVRGVSISRAQIDYAQRRLAEQGVAAQTAVEFCDYRDLGGQYQHIVSIEMFEAVGETYWPIYCQQLKKNLAADGRIALQVITIDHERFESYRRTPDFIQRHVFPGGMLPSKQRLIAELNQAGLEVTDVYAFGKDYATTLVHWRRRFDAAWSAIEPLGFDSRFKRLWHYYLAYCEAGFNNNAIDVVQLAARHA